MISLVSSYHPTTRYTTKEISKHISNTKQFFNEIPHRNLLIIGANINATTGNRNTIIRDTNDEDMIPTLIGPHGNPRINASSELVLIMLCELNLRAASTLFDNNGKHDTWILPGTKQKFQLDHFLILSTQLCFVTNIKQKFNDSPSDHAALMIKIRINQSSKLILKKGKGKHSEVSRKVLKIDNKLRLAGGK